MNYGIGRWAWCVIAAAALAAGCSPSGDDGFTDYTGDRGRDDAGTDDGGGTDFTPDPGSDPGTDYEATDHTPEACDEQPFEATRIIPDMLIVLDRSNSMSPASGGFWAPVAEAILNVTESLDTQIWFGLMAFPNAVNPLACNASLLQNQCEPAHGVLVEVGDDRSYSIGMALSDVGTCGGTPTALTLQAAQTYLTGLTDEHPKYVLLATDGGPNCNGVELNYPCRCTGVNCDLNDDNCLDDARTIRIAGELYAAGITTYVIGIATGEFTDVMNGIASAGGTGTALSATDSASILDAFESIAGTVATCEWDVRLPTEGADPLQVNFYFGDRVVPQDDDGECTEGWQWMNDEHTQVEFCGSWCDEIFAGTAGTIRTAWGCPTIFGK